MKTNNKVASIVITVLNILGIICLVYLAIPYVTYDTVVKYPDAMLPAEAWDAAGMALTIGLIPLIIVNLLGYKYINFQKKFVRLIWLIPGIVCLMMVISYWMLAL